MYAEHKSTAHLQRRSAKGGPRKITAPAAPARAERFHRFFDLADVGMVQVEPESGRFLLVNPKFCELTGYTEDELLALSFLQLTHPEDREADYAGFSRMVRGEVSVHTNEKRYVRKDGQVIWVRTTVTLERDASGHPRRTVAIVQDTTARREAEQAVRRARDELEVRVRERTAELVQANAALRRSESILAHAQALAHLGSYEVSVPGPGNDYWSEEVFAILGLDPAQGPLSQSKYLQRLVHPEDRARVAQAFERGSGAGLRFDLEYRILRPDGALRHVRNIGEPVCDSRGQVTRLIGTLHDITEKKAAEEAQSRLVAIVQSSNNAIIGMHLDGTITSWNVGAESIYGYTAGEMIGQSIFVLSPADHLKDCQRIYEALHRSEQMDCLETLHLRKDRTPVHVSLAVSLVKDAAGKILGAAVIGRDISMCKRLAAEVLQISEREQRRIAQDVHDGLGQLLTGLVHLGTALEQKLAGQGSPEAPHAARMVQLLNDAVAQARSVSRGLYPVKTETNGLMLALRELAARTTEMCRVTCEFHLPKPPVLLENNTLATHLYRIAQEAVANAVKHGQPARIDIRLAETPERIVLEITDDGRGIPLQAPDRKGLGLRIMSYRAGMIGGSLAVQNELEGGTRVVCTVQKQAFNPPLEP